MRHLLACTIFCIGAILVIIPAALMGLAYKIDDTIDFN